MGLSVERVATTTHFSLAEHFVNRHHSYIRWTDRPSRKLYWLLREDGRLVGVFGLGSAYVLSPCVRAYVAERALAFNEIGHNIVYCLHGTRTPHAASALLRLVCTDAIVRWHEAYGDEIKAFQTFILPPRTGSSYLGDNWRVIGETSGQAMALETLRADELAGRQGVYTRTFADGTVKHAVRHRTETDVKLVLMRDVSARERRRAHARYRPPQLGLF